MPAVRFRPVDISTLVFEYATYLANQTNVGSLGGNVFYNSMPATPYDLICIVPESRPLEVVLPMEQHSFQIYVRNQNKKLGSQIAERVMTLIHGRVNVLPTLKGQAVSVSSPGTSYPDANNHTVYPLTFNWVGQT